MENAQGEAADWALNLMRDFQDKITCGLFESIYALDGPSQDTLMEGQARACVSAFVDLTGLTAPMDLDAFLDAMATSGASKVDTQREGDVL